MLVFRGLDLVGARLCGERLPGVTFLAVGRGDPAWGAQPPAVPATATGLVDETFRVRISQIAIDAEGVVVDVTLPAGLGELRELALFGGDASPRPGSGFLVAYRRHAPTSERERTLRLAVPAVVARALAGQDAQLRFAAIGTGTRAAAAPGLGSEVARAVPALRYDTRTRTVVASARFDYDEGAGEIRESGLFSDGGLVAYESHAPLDRTQPRVLEQRFELSLTSDREISVPTVTGEPLTTAREAVEAAGLAVALDERAGASGSNVLEQSPAAGASARPGHVVTLAVAAPPRVAVPRLAGATPQGAAATLAAADLTLAAGAPGSEPSERPAGTVLRSAPPAGALVEPGAAVAIVVAAPVRVAVPDVRAQTAPVAAAMLAAAGLALATAPHPTEESSADAGTILAQTPTAGALAEAGTSVRVTLATGWTVVVPDLSKVDAAKLPDELAKAGADLLARLGRPPQPPALALGARHNVEADGDPGRIIGQRPPAGTRVPLHQAVDVDLATRRTVAVPPLIGRLQLDGVAAVLDAGLAVGRIRSLRRRSAVVAATVLEQDPPAGLRVPTGTVVDLGVAAPLLAPLPDVRGLPFESAAETLRSRGFDVGAISTKVATGNPPGEVLEQTLAARSQQPLGTRVPLTIVSGNLNLVGLPIKEARRVLADAGVAIEKETQLESDAPPGTVLVHTGKATLTIAAPFAPVAVPNLVRTPPLTVEAATAELAAVKLKLEQTGTVQSDAPPGAVADQAPKPPATLPRGGVVGVKIAMPRLPLEVEVPDVTGLAEAAARTALEAAGLRLELGGQEPSVKPAGSVIRQAPAAKARVARTSAVSVFVALSPDAVTAVVPDVRGLTKDAARRRLEASKLFAAFESRPTDAAPAGNVVAQAPLSGVRVSADSFVTVEVAVPPPVAVPDLLGLPETAARAAVGRLGLTLEITRTLGGRSGPFVVISQEPAAGAPLARGQEVRVVTAR